MEKIYCTHSSQLSAVAADLIKICKSEKIWIFKGRMGAGKTTLIQAIARQFGIEDTVSSPTFSIVNEYQGKEGEAFYHFDFYRVEDAEEALGIGVDEYFYSGQYCWVEWAEKIAAYIPENFALIEIVVDENEQREITINIIRDGS